MRREQCAGLPRQQVGRGAAAAAAVEGKAPEEFTVTAPRAYDHKMVADESSLKAATARQGAAARAAPQAPLEEMGAIMLQASGGLELSHVAPDPDLPAADFSSLPSCSHAPGDSLAGCTGGTRWKRVVPPRAPQTSQSSDLATAKHSCSLAANKGLSSSSSHAHPARTASKQPCAYRWLCHLACCCWLRAPGLKRCEGGRPRIRQAILSKAALQRFAGVGERARASGRRAAHRAAPERWLGMCGRRRRCRPARS